MYKKSVAVFGVAAAMVFGASSAALADTYPPQTPRIIVDDPTISVGVGDTITIVDVPADESTVVFAITSGPGGGSLASIVAAAAPAAVSKAVVSGSASAEFTPTANGDHTVTVTGGSGTPLGSVTISVSDIYAAGSGSGTGGTNVGSVPGGLAVTGGVVPAAALWLGVGAIGIGGIATAAVSARRRAASKR